DARLEQRGVPESRKTKGQIVARGAPSPGTRHALARCRLEPRAVRVVGHLESAPLAARDAIEDPRTVVDPDGQPVLEKGGVAGRGPEEEDLLPGGPDPIADHLGEERAEPRTARENVAVRRKRGAVGQAQRSHRPPGDGARLHLHLPVLASLRLETFQDSLAGPAPQEVPGLL